MQLSDQQGQAVKVIAGRVRDGASISWLAGFAGSGKTTLAPWLIDEIGAKKPLYVAPTNKAARVLASKIGTGATSLHKAIYFPPDEDKENGHALTWEVCPTAPASSADLILVDEASMVGTKLGNDLASFGVPIVAIGDPGQLPPVKDDPYFCKGEPDFMLTEIHRQARDNPIIRLCHDIRQGIPIEAGSMGDAVIIARRGDVDIDPENMPQVITGTHKRRWQITSTIREVTGNEGWLPNPGEPLICKKNSQETSLINGMMCQTVDCKGQDTVCKINLFDDESNWLEVDASTAHFAEHRDRRASKFSPQRTRHELFDFAWAITCHSAQGSQWDDVLVYDEGYVFRDEATRWRYTAASRAAERLTIILP